ncbi:MAG: bifunctional glycosyltransferase family 2/GtrA family protein [Lachnospiraceae bacterium]|nr:bifunctional glycosyltransferase family 2/GtrA family protein [Lachnospiraceae bacterium]
MAENTMEKLIVLVPAYCPEPSMVESVKALSEQFPAVVVVDDGCPEKYGPVFDSVKDLPGVVILRHPENRGKGCALKTGFSYILEHYPDASGVVTLDADGQHTVKDTLACCERFLEQPDSIVFGCRDFTSDEKIPPRSRFGNRLTSRLMKFFCDIKLSDTQTGLRVHAMSYLPELVKVAGERYEYEMNVIFRLKELDVAFVEVPIEVIYLDNNSTSHFNPIKDSLKIYKVFFRFILASLASYVLDYGLGVLLKNKLLPMGIANGLLPLVLSGHETELAVSIARVCSGIFNYSLNRLVFGAKDKGGKSGVRYFALWFVQMLLTAGLIKLLADVLHVNYTISYIVVSVVLFLISYKIQQVWVFKNKKKEGE